MPGSQDKKNPALRLLGLPGLPRKLPSRNWRIFWGITISFTAAIIYDVREKRKATARWATAVAPLAKEPVLNPSAMPRRVTIFLEAPPGDGLRVAQDHFAEYIKPVLASSGLDWEFVVGRQQGDVRAVVAERVRRARRAIARDLGELSADDVPTDEDLVESIRRRNGIENYEGTKGDIVVGRHTWKEYVRGLHEGWLGPLAPPSSESSPDIKPALDAPSSDGEASKTNDTPSEAKAETKRPTQPPPYINPEQYPLSPLPRFIPAELGPSVPIGFPHILGFFNTPTRLYRFLNRRSLADDIGQQVASVCFCTYRDYKETADGYEQENALAHEERDWVKRVWKDDSQDRSDSDAKSEKKSGPDALPPKEKIWTSPIVLDSRIAARMRRFSLNEDDHARARQIVVPEEQVEGWTKGKIRQLGRWLSHRYFGTKKGPNVGNLEIDG